MASGSITTLGLGSGLDLQDMLDQLKAADRVPITRKETQKSTLEQEKSAYNSLSAKLLAMKTNSLFLSLGSNFLQNSITVSDEDILTATVGDGVAESSANITVNRKASQSSWQTAGVDSRSAVIYPEPDTGIIGDTVVVTGAPETMTILYGAAGGQKSIATDLTSGMSLNDIAQAINTSADNTDGDNQLVTATVSTNDSGNYYIRLHAANGGNSAESQISVSGFDYVKADTTIAIALAGVDDPGYVSLAPGTTYTEAANLINSATGNPGVTAQVIDDGTGTTPYRLTIVSNATGEDNRISIQNLIMEEVSGNGSSLNAELEVNGITYERQSNTGIDDIISGVKLSIKKTGDVTVGVESSMASVKENILALVSGFNDLVEEIRGTDSDTGTDDTEATSPLSDSYTAKSLIFSLQSVFGTRLDLSGSYTSLYDFGLEFDKTGKIVLNETTLDEAINADPGAVKSLFIGDTENNVTGLGDIINNSISDLVRSSGVVALQIEAIDNRMTRLDTDISNATKRLDKRYEILTSQFNQLDTVISQLNSQAQYLQSVIDSFNNSQTN
ncbi:MAG: flagellar filament capping protein FliD [Pseudomonadota bacterium]